jgi:2-phosphosulfolactate phosphatase
MTAESQRTTDVGGGAFDPWPPTDVHLEWGPEAAAQAAMRGDVVVIVDILSFSTTISIAVGQGATALVYAAHEIDAMGGRAAAEARLGAEMVAKERAATTARFSLSPASLATIGSGDRVIFTSLNGARCLAAAGSAPAVLVGSFLNRSATVAAALRLRRRGSGRCTVVACGERWTSVAPTDDSLRPGIEDQLGAGAVITGLAESDLGLSPEAHLAAAAYAGVADRLDAVLASCTSGRELAANGFAADVALAAGIDTTDTCAAWLPSDGPIRQLRNRAG